MGLFETGRAINGQVGIFSRSRPLRIAFILEDDADAQQNLDSIFSYSYDHWGGKRFLIVPSAGGIISDSYWLWLKAHDPDVIYAYCDLPDALVARIDGTIRPFHFIEHKKLRVQLPHPDISVHGLSSLSTLPAVLARASPTERRAVKILGFYDHRDKDRFVTDTFGGDLSLSPSLSPALKKLVEPLAIVAGPEPRLGVKLEDQVAGSTAVLSRMASESTLTLAQLAGLRIPQDDFGYQPWAAGLNLVVGDSFVDRVTFWNGRLLVRPSDDRGFSGMRVPSTRLNDPDFLDALCRFLDKSAWQLPGGSSQRPTIRVRTHSVAFGSLTSLVERLRTVARCPTPPPEHIPSADTYCPTGDRINATRGMFREEHRQYVSHTRAHVAVPAPPHLEHIDPADTELLMGCWIVERKIERHNNLSQFVNKSHWWCLPKRLELAQSFMVEPIETTSRIVDGGLIAHTATARNPAMLLNLPEDDEVFSTVLYRRPHLSYSDRRELNLPPIGNESRISDKGQYLAGTVGRFGGLWDAYQFVQSRFWRGVFGDLCGRPEGEQDQSRLIATLKKRMGRGTVPLASDDQWRSLALVVESEARQIRFPRRYAKLDSLYRRWLDDLAGSLSETPHLHNQLEEIVAGSPRELEDSLAFLCSLGVFTQGFEFRCKACGNRNVFSVDTLRARPACSLCARTIQLPVRFDWHFFFDPLIAESIREHGTLAQLWALGALLEQSRECFFYLPPQKLQLTSSEQPVEVDLICISDGKLLIGEVKPEARDFGPDDQEALCKLARAIDPDILVLSCLERKSIALDQVIAAIRQQLNDARCEVIDLTPQGRFFDGDLSLPG